MTYCYELFSFVITLLLFSDVDYSLNMSDVSGNQVTGYHLEGTLMNGAHLAVGYHGNGLHLDGIDDYLDLGFQGSNCLGNLTLCRNGLNSLHVAVPNQPDNNQAMVFR